MKQMMIPSGTDYCTFAWAAELLGVSQRQVYRIALAGKLDLFRPLVGSRESSRAHRMLSTEQVRDFARARSLTKKVAMR
jgi:hypothetical protein